MKDREVAHEVTGFHGTTDDALVSIFRGLQLRALPWEENGAGEAGVYCFGFCHWIDLDRPVEARKWNASQALKILSLAASHGKKPVRFDFRAPFP